MKSLLIMVNAEDNNNKFYEIELIGDMVHAWNGRVGKSRVAQPPKPGGEKEFRKRKAAKIKKGYKESSVDLDVNEEDLGSKGNLLEIAMEQIKTDKFSEELIKRLVAKNIHNITSNTKIKYDIKTGYFKTPLGIVTKTGVDKAMNLLYDMKALIANGRYNKSRKNDFIHLNEEYFTQIPTTIDKLRDFNNLLITNEKIDEQLDICKALIDSIDIIADEKAKIKAKAAGVKVKHETIFDTSITRLTDKKEFKKINDYFEKSKNKNHGSYINGAKIENIYNVSLKKEEKEYRHDLPNQKILFHGTRVSNLLSIIKSGLLMPKYSPGSVTGYMFSNVGLYFANSSTKSLNYCDGMYWNNSKKEEKIYMFIADIAMGNYQVPRGPTSKGPDKGYDSYWAKPGISGILNDEMIIPNNNQIKLKYILEIVV